MEELAGISIADALLPEAKQLEPKVMSEVDPDRLGFTYISHRSRFVSTLQGQVIETNSQELTVGVQVPVAEPAALIPIVKWHQALKQNSNYFQSFGSWTPESLLDEVHEQSWVLSWQPAAAVPEGCHCTGELARLHCARGLCGNAVVRSCLS